MGTSGDDGMRVVARMEVCAWDGYEMAKAGILGVVKERTEVGDVALLRLSVAVVLWSAIQRVSENWNTD